MKILANDRTNTWFTSDLHFGHRFIVASRNMASVDAVRYRELRAEGIHKNDIITDAELQAMNEMMVELINSRVKPGDTLYILGDFTDHGSVELIRAWGWKLNGNIHLIKGNHDDMEATKNAAVFQSIRDYREFSSRANRVSSKFVMGHYAFKVWNGCHNGSINLHGHSHGNGDNGNLKQFDLGIDSSEAHEALGLEIPGPGEPTLMPPLNLQDLIDAAETRTGFPAYDHHEPGMTG